MKLRNKKTGEIIEAYYSGKWVSDKGSQIAFEDLRGGTVHTFDSLAELNEEWEDYDEPKEYWYIDDAGVIQIDQILSSEINMRKSIGNYFETEEEAEKVVEKLKAWKRLKDKGFRFIDHIDRDAGQGMTRYEWDGYVNDEDLDLLFGGEE